MINKESFENIKQQLKLMSNEQLAALNYFCWAEATDRAAVQTGKEIEELVEKALNQPS